MTMMLGDYRTLGDPDSDAPPSRGDERRQAEAERTRDRMARQHYHHVVGGEGAGRTYIGHTHDDDAPGHTHESERKFPKRADGGYIETLGPGLAEHPPMSPETTQRLADILRPIRYPDPNHPRPPLMRWRLRLFCGHVIETTAHTDHKRCPDLHRPCPECSRDPVVVIAARPVGLDAPASSAESEVSPRRRARSSIKRDLAQARREVRRLEAELNER
jgi:hypothetical protein